MSLVKSRGNMYPWVTHTHTHLGGKCPHGCSYCYVQAIEARFRMGTYAGPLRLLEDEFAVKYGAGKTIFIEHCNDLFAEDVPAEWIFRVLEHCARYPKNTYVFQTKNPARLAHVYRDRIPAGSLVGTTIETNHWVPEVMGRSPGPVGRQIAMLTLRLQAPQLRRFVTIEPILAFDLAEMVRGIYEIGPEFVNIGADSKGHGLPEPTAQDVGALIFHLRERGIEIRRKSNLERLAGRQQEGKP